MIQASAPPTDVVPAQAGTHTPYPGDVARWWKQRKRGGYGSPLARGRQRRCPLLLGALLVGLFTTQPARAETIRIVIPFAPGGALDPIARILANGWNKLRPSDSIIVENIGGAGGVVGMSGVAKAPPDGRTLLFSPSGNIVISPSLQPNLPYDTPRAFELLVLAGSVKSALIARASLGVNTLPELIARAKTTTLTFGSPGPGTSPHISGELLNHAASISITHVPFRGLGPALNNLIGGHIDVITTSVIGVLPYVEAKTARALATFDTERSDRIPDVPTTVELGFPDLVMPQWYGLFAPAGIAPDLKRVIETQVLAVLRSPDVVAQLAASGVAHPKGSAEFRLLLDAEFKKWPALIPKLGIKAE
jgi:tripartite-type tricarboxylate transporter receptor subunit TctC